MNVNEKTLVVPNLGNLEFLLKRADRNELGTIDGTKSSVLESALIVCLQEGSSKESNVAIASSTFLKRVLIIASEFKNQPPDSYFNNILSFIYSNWDSPVDVICYDCGDIFQLLLLNHSTFCKECCEKSASPCSFVQQVAKELFSSPQLCKAIYRCILILVETHDCTGFVNRDFVQNLYSLLGNASLSAIASRIIVHDLIKCNIDDDRSFFHVSCFVKALTSETSSVRSAIKDRLIPVLFKSAYLGLKSFVNNVIAKLDEGKIQIKEEAALEAILSLTQLLVNHESSETVDYSTFISATLISKALLYVSDNVRFAAYNLICNHPRTKREIKERDLQLVFAYFKTNFSEQSPATRQKILATLKKLLASIRNYAQHILKKEGEYPVICKNFILELITFSFNCLDIGANFSRRIMALSVIDVIFHQQLEKGETDAFLKWMNLPGLLTKERYNLLLCCLDDSFELCQNKALELLKNMPFPELVLFDDEYYMCTMEMIKELRSHTTLSACYRIKYVISMRPSLLPKFLDDVLRQLTSDLESAEANLMLITERCIHPALNALAIVLEYIFKYITSLEGEMKTQLINFVSTKVLSLCFRIADLVNPVVHSMSPEGYIPEDHLAEMTSCGGEDSIKVHAETSQMLLACCWRAHKHVSHILAWSVATFIDIELPDVLLDRICSYYWLQLTECKHCGAFESAVEGFTLLCTHLWNRFKTFDGVSEPVRIPEYWLRCILSSLDGNSDGLMSFCATRRSAGVPHLIVSIISTEPSDYPVQSLHMTLSSLLEMKNKSTEQRVHCFNVLTAMFSSASIGDRISIGLEWACRASVNGCSSKDWPERNAAAQLAAALKIRIFGVTRTSQRDLHVDAKNKQSAFEFFTRFPSLYSYLYTHLLSARDEFSVYPILIFLTHLFPTNSEEYSLNPFISTCLRILLSSNAEKLRRLAATAAITVTKEEDQTLLLSWLNTNLKPEVSQNHVHGTLLLIDNILHYASSADVTKLATDLVHKMAQSYMSSSWCDFNYNVFLELCMKTNVDPKIELLSTSRFVEFDLSKRHVAHFILAHSIQNSVLLDDAKVRHEMYRWMQLESKLYKPTSEFVRYSLCAPAVTDLKESNQKYGETILDVLYDQFEQIPENLRETLKAIIERRLVEDFTTPCAISLARRLLFRLSDKRLSSGDLEWLKSTIDEEDSDAKHIAIDVACSSFFEDKSWNSLVIAAEFFLDDDLAVREQVSSWLTPLVAPKCDFLLNPIVCYWLLQRLLEQNEIASMENIINPDSNDTALYDACVSNTYRERIFFGNLDEVIQHVLVPYGATSTAQPDAVGPTETAEAKGSKTKIETDPLLETATKGHTTPSDANNKSSMFLQLAIIGTISAQLIGDGSITHLPERVLQYGGFYYWLAHIFLVLFMGLPIVFFELLIGQITGKGVSAVYGTFCKAAKGVGISLFLLSMFLMTFGVNLSVEHPSVSWKIFTSSLAGDDSILRCGNDWNSKDCISLYESQLNCPRENDTDAKQLAYLDGICSGIPYDRVLKDALKEYSEHECSETHNGVYTTQLIMSLMILVAPLLLVFVDIKFTFYTFATIFFVYIVLFFVYMGRIASLTTDFGDAIKYIWHRSEHGNLLNPMGLNSLVSGVLFSLSIHGVIAPIGSFLRPKDSSFRIILIPVVLCLIVSTLSLIMLICGLQSLQQYAPASGYLFATTDGALDKNKIVFKKKEAVFMDGTHGFIMFSQLLYSKSGSMGWLAMVAAFKIVGAFGLMSFEVIGLKAFIRDHLATRENQRVTTLIVMGSFLVIHSIFILLFCLPATTVWIKEFYLVSADGFCRRFLYFAGILASIKVYGEVDFRIDIGQIYDEQEGWRRFFSPIGPVMFFCWLNIVPLVLLLSQTFVMLDALDMFRSHSLSAIIPVTVASIAPIYAIVTVIRAKINEKALSKGLLPSEDHPSYSRIMGRTAVAT